MSAKSRGFLLHGREKSAERPPRERLNDWDEFIPLLPTEKLQQQGMRCMDCGVPFCHEGQILNGMTSGCPINNLIPEWNDLVYRGLWREAYARLDKTNNFPEFTGRVCPAPCEGACVLGISQPPVTIKSIEHAIIDRAFAEGWVRPNTPETRTGKRVAVIGSGPAGLACADQLNRVGHHVTVYERADRIGGLLTYGIPAMKLDKAIVQRRVDLLAEAGITFETGCEVGRDIAADALRDAFDAIVIATGATRPRDLAAPGRELAGIDFAMDFLTGNTQRVLAAGGQWRPGPDAPLSAAGQDVIVIGGGDTGTDCVATALRHGCRSLTQFEIMDRPPDQRAADNPWPQWPRIFRQDYGQVEAEAVFGADPRRYAISTKAFLGDDSGLVRAVRTVDVRWERSNGSRPKLVEVPGTEREWPAQRVLLALGFLGPENPLLAALGVETDARSNVAADYGAYATSVDGIFAAGDARRGQSLVVWAINEGRECAREVDRWLMGETDLP